MEPWHRHLSPPRPVADDASEPVVGAPPAYDDAATAHHAAAADESHDADSSVYVDDGSAALGSGAGAFAQHTYKDDPAAAHHMGAAADMLDAAAIGMALQHDASSGMAADTSVSADAAGDTSYSASPRQAPAQQQHNTPFAKHLGRNRACGACRDRKLKCDGARPICGQCGRAWAVKKKSMLAKGHSQAEVDSIESPCQYIALEPKTQKKRASSSGGANASGSRKKVSVQPSDETEKENVRLAREVAELRAQLEQQQASSSSSRLPDGQGPQHSAPAQNGSRYQGATSDELSIAEILATTMRAGDGGFTRTASSPGFDVDGAHARIALDPSLEDFVESLPNIGIHVPANVAGTGVYPHPLPHHAGNRGGDPQSTASIMDNLLGEHGSSRGARTSTGGNAGEADPMLELVWSGWPSDFPPPATVNELVGVFFEKFSYLHIFHPARFMLAMSLGPTNPRYPNPAILHAMFALAYTIRPELDPVATKRSEENSTQRAAQLVVNALATTTNKYLPLAQGLAEGTYDRHQGSPGSAAYHTQRAQHHITHGTWEGGNLYDIMRAATLLCNKKYACGELLDAWMLSAHCTRLLAALGLNRSEKRHTPRGSGRPIEVTRLSMSAPPVDWIDEEERRRATYLVFITDGSAAATTLWPGSLVEQDVSCDLPVVPSEKWATSDLSGIDYSQRQTLQSPSLLTTQHVDSLSLLIKGFLLVSRSGCLLARLPVSPTEDDLMTSDFHQLSNSIGSYSMSIPPHLASYATLKADGHVDVALVTAHALPHLATLLLHDPMVNTRNESFTLCSAACSGVLGILRFLAVKNEDLALFPAMFTYALSMTGKNIIRRYVRSLSTNDRQPQELARSEIDLIIRSLCKYGQRWAIGYRQAHALARELGIDFRPEMLSETFGIFDGPQVPPPAQGAPPRHDSSEAPSHAGSSPEDFFRAR